MTIAVAPGKEAGFGLKSWTRMAYLTVRKNPDGSAAFEFTFLSQPTSTTKRVDLRLGQAVALRPGQNDPKEGYGSLEVRCVWVE